MSRNATVDEVLDLVTGEAESMDAWITMQRMINSGDVWMLEGSMGRAANDALESGHCMLGKVSGRRDYWGSRIPSRTEVKPGTKGSYAYVRRIMGDKWARKMGRL